MRVAYLCKRQYMSHDVIVDRYARLYEQPYQLALLGHDVLGLCLSYRPVDERDESHEASPGSLRWIGLSPGSGMLARGVGLIQYPKRALDTLRDFSPDILVGASDCPHIILGERLAKNLGIPYAADLYDHFESFGLSRLPGMVPRFRRALQNAAVVSCVSEPLADLVKNSYRAKGNVLYLPSTISRETFFPQDRDTCRAILGLPHAVELIGTAGGLSADKGITPLYEAFEKLSKERSDVHLVLAGKPDPACPPPASPRVHFLGQLPHSKIGVLFNALDVGVVYVRDTPYGRYSFPQKAYEMAACEIPMAVACVGAMEGMCKLSPSSLYEAENTASLIACLQRQLDTPSIISAPIPSWADQAKTLADAYQQFTG